MRFRRNIERIGEIMSYRLSELHYTTVEIETPLGIKKNRKSQINWLSVPFYVPVACMGFLNYFDQAENGFISAYRQH
jgi:uracil phosphoribosyltransferase